MIRTIQVCVLILLIFEAYSQNQNSLWMFGDSSLIDFSNTSNPVTDYSAIRSRGSSASISDNNGNLLFYYSATTGCFEFLNPCDQNGKLYNKNHQLMQGGDSLITGLAYNEGVIIPDPSNNNKFYLFILGVTGSYGVYYAIIDMSQSNGNGAVLQKNIQLVNWEPDDGIIAIKHGNGKDWWVIAKRGTIWTGTNLNEWYLYLVDSAGVHAQPMQVVGSLTSSTITHLSYNSQTNKICFLNYKGLVEIYDFDRCTGIISNTITIHPEVVPTPRFWSTAFSSSGQYLYVSTSDSASCLYQYDLFASNIPASRITIDSFYDFAWGGGTLKLAPDNKIYYSIAWNDGVNFNFPYPDTAYNMYNMNLSVINDPDQPGLACNFTPFSFYLGGKRTYWGLPNNPDYELGPMAGSMCDTIVGVSEVYLPLKDEFYFYPNPAKDEIKINYACKSNCVVEIIDITGRIVLNKIINEKLISLQKIPGGTYYIALKEDNKTVARDLIQIIK